MYIEKHISNLKQYIKDDEIIEKDGSDFANFCKGHIDDIQAVLNELEKKDTDKDGFNANNQILGIKSLNERKQYIDQLETDNYELNNRINDYIEERQKLIEKLEEDIKVNQENYKTNTEVFEEYWSGCIDTEQEILSILKGEKE